MPHMLPEAEQAARREARPKNRKTAQPLVLIYFIHPTFAFYVHGRHIHMYSMCIYIYVFICLSFYLSIFLSFYRSILLSCYLAIYLSFSPSLFRSFYLSMCLSIYLSIHPPNYLSTNLPTYLPTYLSMSRQVEFAGISLCITGLGTLILHC